MRGRGEAALSGTDRVIALGTFDGLHIAHCAVLRGANAALLFTEHPQKFLRGKAPPQLLTDEERDARMREMGLELLRISFGEIAGLAPEAFFTEILCGRFHARGLRCGFHYRFGAQAAGGADLLRALCDARGVTLEVEPKIEYRGEVVSSTRIRAALRDGQITDANTMLGRAFGYAFEVVPGDRVGRSIGIPTINQRFPEGFMVPKRGAYVSQAFVNGEWCGSVTNIGRRPSFQGGEVRSETHIIGFDGDLYGARVPVRLLDYIRPEMRFYTPEALRARILEDVRVVTGERHANA